MLSRDGTCSSSKYPEHTEESLYEQRVHAGGRTKKLPSLSGSRTPKQHKLRNVPMRKLCKNHRKGQRSLLNNVQEMKPAEHARGQHPNKTLPMMGARG